MISLEGFQWFITFTHIVDGGLEAQSWMTF
jgi:hypothetical protein